MKSYAAITDGRASNPVIWGRVEADENYREANGHSIALDTDIEEPLRNEYGGHFYTVDTWFDRVVARWGKYFGIPKRTITIAGINSYDETCLVHNADGVELVVNGNVRVRGNATAAEVGSKASITIVGAIYGLPERVGTHNDYSWEDGG